MNNNRRSRVRYCISDLLNLKSEIKEIVDSLNTLSNLKKCIDNWSQSAESINDRIYKILCEECDALSNIPDNFVSNEIADSLERTSSDLSSADTVFSFVTDQIDKVEDAYINSFIASFTPMPLISEINNIMESIDITIESLEKSCRF